MDQIEDKKEKLGIQENTMNLKKCRKETYRNCRRLIKANLQIIGIDETEESKIYGTYKIFSKNRAINFLS